MDRLFTCRIFTCRVSIPLSQLGLPVLECRGIYDSRMQSCYYKMIFSGMHNVALVAILGALMQKVLESNWWTQIGKLSSNRDGDSIGNNSTINIIPCPGSTPILGSTLTSACNVAATDLSRLSKREMAYSFGITHGVLWGTMETHRTPSPPKKL